MLVARTAFQAATEGGHLEVVDRLIMVGAKAHPYAISYDASGRQWNPPEYLHD